VTPSRPDATAADPRRRRDFEAIALPHLHALHAFAIRLTRDRAAAEDLVQETFLRAYRFFDRFEPGTNIRAWLFRILKNVFINDYRQQAARPPSVDIDLVAATLDDQVAALHSSSVASPEKALEQAILAADIDEAIAALPEEYRMVVVLCLVLGFKYQEAADSLQIPVGTVMSRLHRGRRFLQARLIGSARERGLITAGTGDPREGSQARSG
jgi:RNA polymerase sigma-70 factor (ECF subfamily)